MTLSIYTVYSGNYSNHEQKQITISLRMADTSHRISGGW